MPQVLIGDCLERLRELPADSVDLIFTSPPYADARARSYGGIHPDGYVQWFLPRAAELLRVLKPAGSFVLNIKEKAVRGERHTYVIELILALRKQGWLWTEEYIWHKKNCYPGKWPNRFRDSWERLLHFNKSRNFKMFQDAVRVPTGDWRQRRLHRLSETDRIRDESKSAAASARTFPTGWGETSPTPPMCCTWPPNAATAATAPPFPKRCPLGSSACSPHPATPSSTLSPAPAPPSPPPPPCTANASALKSKAPTNQSSAKGAARSSEVQGAG